MYIKSCCIYYLKLGMHDLNKQSYMFIFLCFVLYSKGHNFLGPFLVLFCIWMLVNFPRLCSAVKRKLQLRFCGVLESVYSIVIYKIL